MDEDGSAQVARERQLADTFVLLADTLVTEYDLTELLDRLVGVCVEVLGAAAAGLMIADPHGRLQVLAASTEQMRVLELFELQHEQGPCLDAYRSGDPILVAGMDDVAHARWPQFTAAAVAAGFTRVQALPMRLRDHTVGALNLFGTAEHTIGAHDTRIAQALADVATIGLLQQRALSDSTLLADQLQAALTQRLVIEQAKGLLAERGGLSVGQAFELLRGYCRERRLPVAEVAGRLLDGVADADDVLARRWPSGPRDLWR